MRRARIKNALFDSRHQRTAALALLCLTALGSSRSHAQKYPQCTMVFQRVAGTHNPILNALTPRTPPAGETAQTHSILSSEIVTNFRRSIRGRVSTATEALAEEVLSVAAARKYRTSPEGLRRLSEDEVLNLPDVRDFVSREQMELGIERADAALKEGELAFIISLMRLAPDGMISAQLTTKAEAALEPFIRDVFPQARRSDISNDIMEVARAAFDPNIDPRFFRSPEAFQQLRSRNLRERNPSSWAPGGNRAERQFVEDLLVGLRALRKNTASHAPGLADRLGGNQFIPDAASAEGPVRGLIIIGGNPVRISVSETEVGRANIASRAARTSANGVTELRYEIGLTTEAMTTASVKAILEDAAHHSKLADVRVRPVLVLPRSAATPELLRSLPTDLAVEILEPAQRPAGEQRIGRVFGSGRALNPGEAVQWHRRIDEVMPNTGTTTQRDLTNPNAFRLITLQPGETFIERGAPSDSVFVIPAGKENHISVAGIASPDIVAVLGATGVLRNGRRNASVTNTGTESITVLAIEAEFYRRNVNAPRTLAEVAMANRGASSTANAAAPERHAELTAITRDSVDQIFLDEIDFARNTPSISILIESALVHARGKFAGLPRDAATQTNLRNRIATEITRRMTPFQFAKSDPVLRDTTIDRYIQGEAEQVASRKPAGAERDAALAEEIRAGWELMHEIRRLPGMESASQVLTEARRLAGNSRSDDGSSLSRRRDTLALGRRFPVRTDRNLQPGDMIEAAPGTQLYIDQLGVNTLRQAGSAFAAAQRAAGRPLTTAELIADARRHLPSLFSPTEPGRTARARNLTDVLQGRAPSDPQTSEIALSIFLQGAGLDARYALIEPVSGPSLNSGRGKPALFVHLPREIFVTSHDGLHRDFLHNLRSRIRLSDEQPIFVLRDRAEESRTLMAIIAAQGHYREAIAAGHPHARFLEELGFNWGAQTNQIISVPLEQVAEKLETNIQRLVREGKITERDTIRAVRVVTIGEGAQRRYIPVPFEQPIPAGSAPVTGIVPFPESMRMLADGFFVLGEHSPLGPRNAEHLGTVALHDLAHHSLWHQNPTLMAETREAARRLVDDRAYYRRTPDIRNFKFEAAHLKALREANLLPVELTARLAGLTDQQASELLNRSSSRERLDILSVLIQSGVTPNPSADMKPIPLRAEAGLRFTLWLENAFQISKADSERLFGQWTRDGWIAPPAGSTHAETRSTYEGTVAHLRGKNLGNDALTQHARNLVSEFRRIDQPIGGMPRDIFQERQRQDQDPQGYGYYFMPRYMAARTEALLAKGIRTPAEHEELLSLAAKLQVVMLEGGRFTASEWLRDITQKTFDPRTEIGRFFTETGIFPRDLYFSAHGGDLTTPRNPRPRTPAGKSEQLSARSDLERAGVVTEIGAGMKVAVALGRLVGSHTQPYKMSASDQQYGTLGKDGRDGNPADYASQTRLAGQLNVEFDRAPLNSRGIKFAIGVAAETNRSEGHAWIGIKARLTPEGEPVTIHLHLRLNSERVLEQQEQIGIVGLNLAHYVYASPHTGPVDIARLLEGTKDVSIDFVSVGRGTTPPQPSTEDAVGLVRNAQAPGVVFSEGRFKAARDVLIPQPPANARVTAADVDTYQLPAAGADPVASRTSLNEAMERSTRTGRPLIIQGARARTAQEFIDQVNHRDPKPRAPRDQPAPAAAPPSATVQNKAVLLNSLPNTLFSMVHAGDIPSAPVAEIFDARNVRNLFHSAAHDNNTIASKADLLAVMDRSLADIRSNRPVYAKVVLGTRVERTPSGGAKGTVIVKGQRTETGKVELLEIEFELQREASPEALAAKVRTVGINALYFFTRPSEASGVLRDGLGPTTDASLTVVGPK